MMKKKSIFILLCCFLMGIGSYASTNKDQKIKVACIGNSITYGLGTENPAVDSYPAQLQIMLGGAIK